MIITYIAKYTLWGTKLPRLCTLFLTAGYFLAIQQADIYFPLLLDARDMCRVKFEVPSKFSWVFNLHFYTIISLLVNIDVDICIFGVTFSVISVRLLGLYCLYYRQNNQTNTNAGRIPHFKPYVANLFELNINNWYMKCQLLH